MDTKDQAKLFLERLRTLNRSEFPDQNKARGIARETLRVMGDLLIRPVLDELAEAKELDLIEPIANLYIALAALERGKINPVLRPAKKAGRPRGTRIRLPGDKPIESATISVWRKKIKSRRPITPRDAEVYSTSLFFAGLQEVVGIGADGKFSFGPLEEPKRLAEKALKFALGDTGRPPPLWGLEEVDRDI